MVRLEGDALAVASSLAARAAVYRVGPARMEASVAMLNGASRNALGNAWFGGKARSAIDENLHRRSWTMAATSLMLNDWSPPNEIKSRRRVLRRRVLELGGSVHDTA